MAQEAKPSQFDAKDVVETAIAEGPVVMIAKSFCGYCNRAYGILGKYYGDVIRKDIDSEYNDDEGEAIQDYCKAITGGRSVPRVFINAVFIGGCDDTAKLDSQKKLKGLIEAAISK
eukprot:UN07222